VTDKAVLGLSWVELGRPKLSPRALYGRYAVVFFYPRAGSPGCTREVQDFRDRYLQFRSLGAEVLGVSPDPLAAVEEFAKAQGIPFPLLSDSELALARAFGLGGGRRIPRSTFLLDRGGVVRRAWLRVRVDGHADEVLKALEAVRAADLEVNPLVGVRRAHRALAAEPVPRQELEKLVEAAHLAPSCFNNQPWRFVVVTGENLTKVKGALPGGNYWAQAAPAVIAVASHRDLDCKLSDNRDYFLLGCGMAVGFLMIQATQMGLIAHPIAGYDPIAVKKALNIPEDYVLITLVVVGKPGDPATLSEKHREIELGLRDRKPLTSVLFWEQMPRTEAK